MAVNIPGIVMGTIVLSSGTSVPDSLSSIVVARKGEGDMAVASAIANTLAITKFPVLVLPYKCIGKLQKAFSWPLISAFKLSMSESMRDKCKYWFTWNFGVSVAWICILITVTSPYVVGATLHSSYRACGFRNELKS
ncbi:hypothetical protein EMIHUDRAFT_258305 [Emiliania huxleyi CCMP1516]|uniref:Sodium/calcium exchanger membrane region domain-containing protein n=2 Tax=Emiliania huxleyi TaxID=2903 RepID=A0A0D3IAJ7_EMIH1|nr:hypothetical protein EMIHUDRAFT_258305 [Emiliania huxleyi CCMP1516]EOD08282.1 hypothetical protein EMIHUDRAFT_258305 [Emiliania huxleyi CCMP1516]|eukprot:XP_005760711.1 hypothetical protein EMIHUDRAFT_258305 [Emiliania huxleyi CCMP1516]